MLLKEGLTSPLFGPAMALGKALRPFVPAALRDKVPRRRRRRARIAGRRAEHPRKVLLLRGCVQPAMAPNIDSATARVLDACGIQSVVADGAGCCGAIRMHLSDHDGGLADMRRNVDAWWPLVDRGEVEAIVMNASGCGVTVREYGRALAADPAYAEGAARIGELAQDLSEVLPEVLPQLKTKLGRGECHQARFSPAVHVAARPAVARRRRGDPRRARFPGAVADALRAHLCCGSAGTYSVLQPELAYPLRDRKLERLKRARAAGDRRRPTSAASSTCRSGTRIPVRHWIEVVDDALG